MSLYPEKEQLASVYHINDSNSTKVSTQSASADFTINLFIIRRSENDISIMGAEYGDHICNVDASYANSANFRQGDRIVWDSMTFNVINKPRYNETFDNYKLVLKRVE